MAAAKRLTPEQIVARLRDAEKLQAQEATIPQVCKLRARETPKSLLVTCRSA